MSYMSVPLYADDSHLTEFDATVIRTGPRFVILDRTAFYPDMGGQPSDVGVLRYAGGEARVTKVIKRGPDIFHYLDTNIPSGTLVHGIVDWLTRRWNMRRHSAEHLLTGLIEVRGELPKIYSDLERLEYQPSDLTKEQVQEVQQRFDEVVDEDVPVRVYYEDRARIDASSDTRKLAFLRKIPRDVERLRMVEIGTYASTFCFGTHVKRTSEIGHLASISLEEGKKGKRVVHFSLNP